MGNLTYLESLDLSHNNFSGALPSFLWTRLLHLQLLNISFNFTGPIPSHGVFMHLNASCFQGNSGLCGPIVKKECTGPSQGQHHNHTLLHLMKTWRGGIVTALILLIVVIGVELLLHYYCIPLLGAANKLSTMITIAEAKRYSAQELMDATQGYSEVNFLGQGGLSVVYKGVLSDGEIVAIKKLKDVYNVSHKELLQEMHILSKLRHRNLVQILGCVLNLDVKAIVIEYMENGNLEHYLEIHQQGHSNEPDQDQDLSREMVTRVAKGIAHALNYLHHEYGESIIHGDVKPSNILLDSDMEPHLADFGIAKLMQRGANSVSLTSNFKGSIGYMAPEYAYAARITTKVDVYSYGVVLLRMLTGRSPMQVVPDGISLQEWAKSKLASAEGGNFARWEELLAEALVQKSSGYVDCGTSSHLELVQLLHIHLACTSHRPEDRPTIREVVAFLIPRRSKLSTRNAHVGPWPPSVKF